jgi:hypothetical protein
MPASDGGVPGAAALACLRSRYIDFQMQTHVNVQCKLEVNPEIKYCTPQGLMLPQESRAAR